MVCIIIQGCTVAILYKVCSIYNLIVYCKTRKSACSLYSFAGYMGFTAKNEVYEVHTKLPQIAYQIQIWYAICGSLV